MNSFSKFLSNIIVESLHPELQHLISNEPAVSRTFAGAVSKGPSKQTLVVNKIKDLVARGEKTGLEGNRPGGKGSSRLYLPHEEQENITVDGKPASIKVGTKIAIRAQLDKHHNPDAYDGHSLGQLQNSAEHNDWFVNSNYRILRHDSSEHKEGEFESNTETGIFPPLIKADHDTNQWSTVGHAHDLTEGSFKRHTRIASHPEGISHMDFYRALARVHEKDHGKYWEREPELEERLDHVEKHPLVQKFLDHQINTNTSPNDYMNIKNLGVFHHPDGSKHIVARDHGFNEEVSGAYGLARRKMWGKNGNGVRGI